ncbi:hypothetical protein E2C01_003397 [Portunus trituberculatus]|uniref:Uncharacterized protein n=1 Tax=Portunus trituberculatus TaxID=210409 RepID=A0A5B7CM92_PORTR|nr:hypothetical protein [Portunus trituberculatus]
MKILIFTHEGELEARYLSSQEGRVKEATRRSRRGRTCVVMAAAVMTLFTITSRDPACNRMVTLK